MELITVNDTSNQIVSEQNVNSPTTSFIEANTKKVSLEHLKYDCTIPVFAKDNESTISHFQFISKTMKVIEEMFPETGLKTPDIRVSHVIKGRVPSAIGKPAKELLEHEKTIFYERCAFVIEIPSITQEINGNILSLTIGGVRAYNQENLYSKKSLEKFKLFIGFKNKVCTNMCIATDGFSNEIRISIIDELEDKAIELFQAYDMNRHIKQMELLSSYSLNEFEFAHLVGKIKMYHQLSKNEQNGKFQIGLSDSQLSQVVKGYYNCKNFRRDEDGSISLWKLYNLFTEALKSSYIDTNLERNVNSYELVNMLGNSIENSTENWFLHN